MYKNPHKDGIKSIDVPTTTYSKDDHWVKRSVLVSGLDLSTDSIDLSQAVNIVRQVVPKRKENMNFNIASFLKFVSSSWGYIILKRITWFSGKQEDKS